LRFLNTRVYWSWNSQRILVYCALFRKFSCPCWHVEHRHRFVLKMNWFMYKRMKWWIASSVGKAHTCYMTP
jgi:hypothetical protein